MARNPQHVTASGSGPAPSGSERLAEHQTLMAVISDMEMFDIHPPLHADPSTPMQDLATWDPDRLLRISRWKQARGQSKDVVRAYAKAIPALNDLHEAAACVQFSHSRSQEESEFKQSHPQLKSCWQQYP